jgi:pimeloyl-ACP methyl ester carboxylesterase
MRLFLRFLALFLIAGAAWAAPCATTDSACTEWITLGGGPSRLLVYRSYPLSSRNENIRRALLVVHGGGRDADNEFRTALAAAFLAGSLDDTVLVSPRFASNTGANVQTGCADTLAANELSWVCDVQQPDSWRVGGGAIGNNKITSYDAVDEILRKVARKEVFPNLKSIVVAGHSAGGMFVTRYEMTNQVHDKLGVAVSYVVSNPNIYAYPDTQRPADTQNCAGFNKWPYGLDDRVGYSARLTVDQLRKQLAARPTTYLLGDLDTLAAPNWDASCSASAQGPTRLDRGLAFGKYVNEKYGAQHKTVVVRFCGHNSRCMFTAEPALPLLFPKP